MLQSLHLLDAFYCSPECRKKCASPVPYALAACVTPRCRAPRSDKIRTETVSLTASMMAAVKTAHVTGCRRRKMCAGDIVIFALIVVGRRGGGGLLRGRCPSTIYDGGVADSMLGRRETCSMTAHRLATVATTLVFFRLIGPAFGNLFSAATALASRISSAASATAWTAGEFLRRNFDAACTLRMTARRAPHLERGLRKNAPTGATHHVLCGACTRRGTDARGHCLPYTV